MWCRLGTLLDCNACSLLCKGMWLLLGCINRDKGWGIRKVTIPDLPSAARAQPGHTLRAPPPAWRELPRPCGNQLGQRRWLGGWGTGSVAWWALHLGPHSGPGSGQVKNKQREKEFVLWPRSR